MTDWLVLIPVLALELGAALARPSTGGRADFSICTLVLPGTIRERTKELIAGWEIYGLRVVIASLRDDVAKPSNNGIGLGREHSSSRPTLSPRSTPTCGKE